MNQSYWSEFVSISNNVLLLQGPNGHFFSYLSRYLQARHHKTVYKINFNGGDEFFYRKDGVRYESRIEEFYDYLLDFVVQNQIDNMICFGHKRAYHRVAKKLCLDLKNVNFWVFEEGYLRPNFITFEKWGVNNDSMLPKNTDFYRQFKITESLKTKEKKVATGFFPRALAAIQYYVAMRVKRKKFPYYQHHRNSTLFYYIVGWLVAFWRTLLVTRKDRSTEKKISTNKFPPFFIVPLQAHNDSQIRDFSRSKNVCFFIRQVIISFAGHAKHHDHLIFKHHPMDRGFVNYQRLIDKLAKKYQIEKRVHYVLDIKMPIFLRKGKGMVVVNSTSALSALLHQQPVKVLGLASYDFEGLTDQKPLAKFWTDPSKPDALLFRQYRNYLRYKTQMNSNFYLKKSQLTESIGIMPSPIMNKK